MGFWLGLGFGLGFWLGLGLGLGLGFGFMRSTGSCSRRASRSCASTVATARCWRSVRSETNLEKGTDLVRGRGRGR